MLSTFNVTLRCVRANHCCSGISVSITQPVCLFVALGIQHAMRMCHTVICGLPRCIIFFYIISQKGLFSKNRYWTKNVCFALLYKLYLKHFSFLEELSEIWSKFYSGLHVKCISFSSHLNEIWIFSTDFRKKYWNIKFHENPCSGGPVIPSGLTDGQLWRTY